jgi:hypothetical protein
MPVSGCSRGPLIERGITHHPCISVGWQKAFDDQCPLILLDFCLLAEREGFEPPIGLHLCRISSAVHSTTLPPLQAIEAIGIN